MQYENEQEHNHNSDSEIVRNESLIDKLNCRKTIVENLIADLTNELDYIENELNRGNGFIKPTLISDELAEFFNKPSGTKMARTEVTREIIKYVRANNLQDKHKGFKIHPDAKLTTLLKLKANDELTYYNLQGYMKHHFATNS